MIRTLALGPADRVLVFAPHPDDESVATGGLLQHALATGACPLVVYFTDGDNNPWAQRATELRWRIGAAERARFATKRRAEVHAALDRLGVPGEAVRFLGYPDQGATDLLLHGNDVALRKLTEEIENFQPTVVVGPSLLDLHPDHSALGVMMGLALAHLAPVLAVRCYVRFLVHNPRLRARHEGVTVLPLDPEQQARKREAILCHKTQLVLRGPWLPSFAESEERFYTAESAAGLASHPVRRAFRHRGSLTFELASCSRLRAFGSRTLCLVANGAPGATLRLAALVPEGGGATVVTDLRSSRVIGAATFFGKAGHGALELPLDLAPNASRLFVKIERQHGFFDEAGWKEIDLTAPQV